MVNGHRLAGVATAPRPTHQPPAPDRPATVAPAIEPLLLTRDDAAAAMAISRNTLANLTAPRGPIPAVRIGTCVRYRPRDLAAFLDTLQREAAQ